MPRTRATARRRPAPVIVTRMKLVTCAACGRPLDATRRSASEVLTEHYQERHPEGRAD